MKRDRRLYPVCIALLGFSSGCLDVVLERETVRGSGTISVENHAFTGVTGVELATTGELDIRLGAADALQVSADDNLHEYLEIAADGGVLTIRARRGFALRPSRRLHYTLTLREIDFIGLSSSGDASAPALLADQLEIRLASSGDLEVEAVEAGAVDILLASSGDLAVGAIEAGTVDVRLASSGDFAAGELRAGSLDARISSSGRVRIGGGAVDNLDLAIHSSGNYDGEALRSTQAAVVLNSSGDARLWAEESLDAALNSSGSVSYRGDPEVIARTNSSGRVRPIR